MLGSEALLLVVTALCGCPVEHPMNRVTTNCNRRQTELTAGSSNSTKRGGEIQRIPLTDDFCVSSRNDEDAWQSRSVPQARETRSATSADGRIAVLWRSHGRRSRGGPGGLQTHGRVRLGDGACLAATRTWRRGVTTTVTRHASTLLLLRLLYFRRGVLPQ